MINPVNISRWKSGTQTKLQIWLHCYEHVFKIPISEPRSPKNKGPPSLFNVQQKHHFYFETGVILQNRYLPRFFDQFGHQTTYASIGNKHFFTKSCHRQTYQNYEQRPQRLQNSDFQSHFSASKINGIFLNLFFCEEYQTKRTTFTNEIL